MSDTHHEVGNGEVYTPVYTNTPKKKRGRPRKNAVAPPPPTPPAYDPWSASPPNVEEVLRISGIERNYTMLQRGVLVWREGANIDAVLDLVLAGRARNNENLLALHRFMETPYSSGIRCLIGSVLHSTVEKILRDEGALPAIDPAEKSYGQKLLEELEARK